MNVDILSIQNIYSYLKTILNYVQTMYTASLQYIIVTLGSHTIHFINCY